MANRLLCLSAADLTPLLPLPVVIDAVREAFILNATGEGRLFPVVRERLAEDATFGVKSGAILAQGVLGLKAAGSWKGNRKRGDEAHQATVLLMDPATGRPLAVLDGNVITTLRTGAGGALACDLFASPEARSLAVIGTGVQGLIQTEGVLHVRPTVSEVRCFNPHGEVGARYLTSLRGRVDVRVCASVAEAVRGADVVVTATPSTVPLVSGDDLRPGAHVNAIGADGRGKRELSQEMLRTAEVFVDDEVQSRTLGELEGLDDVAATLIGEVLRGAHPGRQGAGVTVFDSTGIALQDLTTAWAAYNSAVESGVGVSLEW